MLITETSHKTVLLKGDENPDFPKENKELVISEQLPVTKAMHHSGKMSSHQTLGCFNQGNTRPV